MVTVIIPEVLPSVAMYYKEGTSDKEYHLSILGSETEGFKVQYRYGRRGAKLAAKWKTPNPVDYPKALEVLETERDKQLSQGYTYGEDGTPYVGTENQGKISGVLPQLLNPIEEKDVETYLNDDSWAMQEKKDGVRQMIKSSKDSVEGVNKKGLVTSLPETTVEDLRKLFGSANAVADGELVGEILWMFDMLAFGPRSFSENTYRERLNEAVDVFSAEDTLEYVKLVPTAIGKASKKAMYKKLKAENAEGVVFKKLDSKYKPGRPASGGSQIKFKFKGSATVRCKHLNDKNSFVMEMLSGGNWIEVGNCTFYPTILVPEPKKLYEVEYLYAFEGGSIFQPVLKEKRTDVDAEECIVSQLKYKQGKENDEE